jgi:hypothetical protein
MITVFPTSLAYDCLKRQISLLAMVRIHTADLQLNMGLKPQSHIVSFDTGESFNLWIKHVHTALVETRTGTPE